MRLFRAAVAARWAAVLPLLLLVGAAPAAASVSVPGVDRLIVTVDDGSGRVMTYDLLCGPAGLAGGTHPDPYGACDRLERLGGPAAPVPQGRMCPMIYGGPQTATVTGTWRSTAVRETYNRANGCEVNRWRAMQPVLPADTAGVPARPRA
jgi:hypothetical protein